MTQTDVQDALVKSEFDLQGRLGNFLISDLLQMIQLSGKTGTLTLLQGWNNRKITFELGRISYVSSGSRLPSQFELLVRTGRLTRHQVEAFRQRRPCLTIRYRLSRSSSIPRPWRCHPKRWADIRR